MSIVKERQIPGYNGSYVFDGDKMEFRYYADEMRAEQKKAAHEMAQARRRATREAAVRATEPERTARIRDHRVRLDEIATAVVQVCGVRQEDIVGGSRKRRVALARHLYWYLARSLTLSTYEEIGSSLGGYDHTSVMHGITRIGRGMAHDMEIVGAVNAALDLIETGLNTEVE